MLACRASVVLSLCKASPPAGQQQRHLVLPAACPLSTPRGCWLQPAARSAVGACAWTHSCARLAASSPRACPHLPPSASFAGSGKLTVVAPSPLSILDRLSPPKDRVAFSPPSCSARKPGPWRPRFALCLDRLRLRSMKSCNRSSSVTFFFSLSQIRQGVSLRTRALPSAQL